MSRIAWYPGITIPQDPDAVRDYTFDFTDHLDGETIAEATVTGEGVTAAKQTQTASGVKVRASALTAARGSVTVRITTSGGQSDDRTIYLRNQQL